MLIRKNKKRSVNASVSTTNIQKVSSDSKYMKAMGKNLSFGASEAYKLLRINLAFSMADADQCRVIGVTSAQRGEGKSTTSINLAYTLAQSGKRILLLEADMRIPVLESVFHLKKAPGLSQVLAGMTPLQETIYEVPMLQNVSILPAGEIPPNPSELLSSKKMEAILKALTSVFEYIIIDLPPVNAVSDSLAVSRLLSGMVMVVRQDYCDQQALAEAMQHMELLDVKVLGFVFNCAEKRYKKYGKGGYYAQGYGYGYGKKETERDADNVSNIAKGSDNVNNV